MRVFIAAILILSNGYALSAEPLAPTPTQKYRMACNASQISVVQACRARCDEAVHECIKRCTGQSCAQQCGPTHSTCQQNCITSSGC